MTSSSDKSDRLFEPPVRWLLGKQLIGELKGILLYTAFGAKLDPRDWMTGEEVSFATQEAEAKAEFWFDYLSDAGDGTKAMYSIAYLALSNLWINPVGGSKELPKVLPPDESQRNVSSIKSDQLSILPRGEFLFFGGDTAYHAAEYMTLVNRIQRPFNYAYEDLRDNKLISDDDPRRPLFGIPGNHDYYDQIDGFRRQFRRPIRKEGPLPPKHSGGNYAQLSIPGFRRVQEASYVALRLPFQWRLWGLDTESASDRLELNLDRRQENFFRSISQEAGKFKAPEKLILATCSPSTVFGKIADADDPKVARPMKALKIETPFLPTAPSNLQSMGNAQLDAGQCRLDLSGDVHHYARYWGPKAPTGSAIRKHNKVKQEATASSYASVVSGSGGAFHHPSTTYDNEICEQVLYPSENVSRSAVSETLFKFWNVMAGGYVWLAGFILAFTIYFGVTVPKSSRQFIANLSFVKLLEIGPPLESSINPTIVQPGNTAECKSVPPFALWTKLGVVDRDWQPPAGCTIASPVYIFADPRPWPLDLKIGQSLLWLSLAAILITFYLSVFTNKIFNDASPFDTRSNPDKKLLPIILVIASLVIVGLLTIQPYRNYFTPFVSSLIVLFSIFAAITAIILDVRYSDYLFKKSFVQTDEEGWRVQITRIVDDYLPWLLWVIAIVVVGSGLWFFGKNNLPAYLVSDIVFIVVLIAAVIGIIVLPFKVGADLLYTSSKPVQFVGKSLIGIWHLLLQLFVPYLLIRNGNYVTWILAALLILLPIPLAQSLLKNDSRFGLLTLWIGYGAVMLALPWIGLWLSNNLQLSPIPVFSSIGGWWRLVPSILSGVVGAVICCLWTGWYFAVCFAFNGHNNEVGGTARIENYKEFIRFRLTPDGLTGYVIAVDDVSKIGEPKAEGELFDGSDLNVKLIDIFHLVPKP